MKILPMHTTTLLLAASSKGGIFSGKSNEDMGNQKISPLTEVISDSSVEMRLSPPKGYGVFATRKILKGRFVCSYEGELLSNEEQEERYPFDGPWPEYCLRLSPEFCIDGANSGHWSRYINHHEDPNLVVRIFPQDDDDTDTREESHHRGPLAYFEAIRTIDVGEELTFDYGPVYFHVRGIVPAPGTESRIVETYEDTNEMIEEDGKKEDGIWKMLKLPELPTTVEDVRTIMATTEEDHQGVSLKRLKKSALVRALDYFGAVEWIDDDSLYVTTPAKGKTLLNYLTVSVDQLALCLENLIREISPPK